MQIIITLFVLNYLTEACQFRVILIGCDNCNYDVRLSYNYTEFDYYLFC